LQVSLAVLLLAGISETVLSLKFVSK